MHFGICELISVSFVRYLIIYYRLTLYVNVVLP